MIDPWGEFENIRLQEMYLFGAPRQHPLVYLLEVSSGTLSASCP